MLHTEWVETWSNRGTRGWRATKPATVKVSGQLRWEDKRCGFRRTVCTEGVVNE